VMDVFVREQRASDHRFHDHAMFEPLIDLHISLTRPMTAVRISRAALLANRSRALWTATARPVFDYSTSPTLSGRFIDYPFNSMFPCHEANLRRRGRSAVRPAGPAIVAGTSGPADRERAPPVPEQTGGARRARPRLPIDAGPTIRGDPSRGRLGRLRDLRRLLRIESGDRSAD
jgi:hypothetical protein